MVALRQQQRHTPGEGAPVANAHVRALVGGRLVEIAQIGDLVLVDDGLPLAEDDAVHALGLLEAVADGLVLQALAAQRGARYAKRRDVVLGHLGHLELRGDGVHQVGRRDGCRVVGDAAKPARPPPRARWMPTGQGHGAGPCEAKANNLPRDDPTAVPKLESRSAASLTPGCGAGASAFLGTVAVPL